MRSKCHAPRIASKNFSFPEKSCKNNIILDVEPQTPSVPIFNRFQWLPFYINTSVAQCCILQKRTQLAVPDYFLDPIHLNSSRHTRNTRFQTIILFVLVAIRQQKVDESNILSSRNTNMEQLTIVYKQTSLAQII